MTLVAVINVEAAVYHDGRSLMLARGDEEDHADGMLAFPGGKLDVVAALRWMTADEIGADPASPP